MATSYHELCKDRNHNSGDQHQRLPVSAETGPSTGSAWRKQGELLRTAVIEQDEAASGQAFVLSSSCLIHRYYQVADKVRQLCVC
jgi:hypothetical protein